MSKTEHMLDDPSGVSVNGDGDIFISDTGNNRIMVFDSNQAFQFEILDGEPGIPLNMPQGIATNWEGMLFVADSVNNQVQVYQGPVDLNVTIVGNGTITGGTAINCPGTCTETFDFDTAVTLTATPTAGNSFVQWSGDCAGTDAVLNITMDQNRDCTATFAENLVPITVTKAGDGAGAVTSSPAGIDCGDECTGQTANFTQNTTVTLTPVAANGSRFAGFTGDLDCVDGTVLADVAKACIATFNLVTNNSNCSVAGPNTTSSSLLGLLLYAVIPAIVIARRRLRAL